MQYIKNQTLISKSRLSGARARTVLVYLCIPAVVLSAMAAGQVKKPPYRKVDEAEAFTIVRAVHNHDEKLVKALLKAKPYLIYAQDTYFTDSDPRPKHDPLIRCVGITGEVMIRFNASDQERAAKKKEFVAEVKSMVDLLLSFGVDINGKNSISGATVIEDTVMSSVEGSTDMLQFLISRKADVNVKDTEGTTPLIACLMASFEVHNLPDYPERISMLINAGALVDGVETSTGKTAIFVAVERHYLRELKQLIAAKANVNAKDNKMRTPLYVAASPAVNSDEAAQQLIEAGAKANVADKDGNTPLHIVSSGKMARLLLKAGASKTTKNKKGQTPLDMAIEAGWKDVILELSK